jgi:hypothetical protein
MPFLHDELLDVNSAHYFIDPNIPCMCEQETQGIICSIEYR